LPLRPRGDDHRHADEAQAYVAGRVPVVAMLVGPGYMSLVAEVMGLPPGSRVGLVCGSSRGVESILETLQLAGAVDVEVIPAVADAETELARVDAEADIVLLSREAMALGLETGSSARSACEWTYGSTRRRSSCCVARSERVDAGRVDDAG
jgi:hypothetical protein